MAQLSTAFAQGTAFTYQGRLNDNGIPANAIYDLEFRIFDLAIDGSQQGGTVTTNDLAVSSGLFTVTLDLGSAVFNGSPRWLQIAVRPGASSGPFTNVVPRQPITAAPYAIFAGGAAASGLTGTLADARLSGNVALLNGAQTFTGAKTFNNAANSFTGNGVGMSNVNALALGGVSANGFWQTGGNAGTTPGTDFLGTTDDRSLELKVHGARALRLEPHGAAASSAIGGYSQNTVGGAIGAAIAGGGTSGAINSVLGDYGFIGAGVGARAGNDAAVVGGAYNSSLGQYSFVGAGLKNTNEAAYSFIGGGTSNLIQSASSSSAIGGGKKNTIQNSSIDATISGGEQNSIGTNSGAAAIGGGFLNLILDNAGSSIVAGGFRNRIEGNSGYGAIGGGENNKVSARYATVGGGGQNTSSGDGATVSGGGFNVASGFVSTVAGGGYNRATGQNAFVGGGFANVAEGLVATVPGGYSNVATGDFSMAAGHRAKASHRGSFVWADSQDFDFFSAAEDQFSIRAAGGIRLEGPAATLNNRRLLTVSDAEDFWLVGGNFVAPGQFLGSINAEPLEFRAAGGVRLSDNTPNLSFGATPRQMLNLWGTQYGIGVQHNTLYFRADKSSSGDGFAWFKGGSHADTSKDPGPGGEILMWLDDRGLDVFRGFSWSLGGALVNDQGGSIELGPKFSAAQTTPFIDFHYGSGAIEDYNVRLWNDADHRLTLVGNLNVTGTITPPSDRNVKAGFEPVDTQEVLAKVAALPITRWHYTNDTVTPHLGPVAQDFHAAFGVGRDDKSIATVDADGVALAAIQGLNQKLEEKLQQKETEITEMKQRLQKLERLLNDKLNGGEQ